MSRHHSGQSRSRPQNGVATPFLLPSPKPGRNTKTRSRPSWKLTYVATSISCRDLVSAQSRISRSRCQNPGLDLPHCYPCRDLKMMSRPQIQLAKSQPQIFRSQLRKAIQRRDLKSMSRRCFRPIRTHDVATSKRGRDTNPQCPLETLKSQVVQPENFCNPARSRHHFLVATSHPTKPGRDLKLMSRPQ